MNINVFTMPLLYFWIITDPWLKWKQNIMKWMSETWPIHQRSFPTCYSLACIAHVSFDIKESQCAFCSICFSKQHKLNMLTVSRSFFCTAIFIIEQKFFLIIRHITSINCLKTFLTNYTKYRRIKIVSIA